MTDSEGDINLWRWTIIWVQSRQLCQKSIQFIHLF